jgi:predicted ATPase
MFVEKLDILNIRSYEKASLEFSPGINLIVGPNNAGKSTILRCLQRLQNGLGGISREDVRKSKEVGKFHVRISGLTIDDNPLFQQKSKSTMIGKWQDIFFNFWSDHGVGKHEEKQQITGGEVNVTIEDDDIKVTLQTGEKAKDKAFHDFPGFPDMENKNNFIFPFLARRKTAHYNSQQGAQSAFGITEQLYNLPARIQNLLNHTHPFSEEYRERCEDILGFAPGKVAGTQTNEDKLGIFVRQEMIYLESMGDGVANVLGLLTILLTEDSKLFLIEELENDIHPEALKKLLTFILEKSRHNQFIISTHSNIIVKYLASIPETKIFYTEWGLKEFSKKPKTIIPTTCIQEIGNNPRERLGILTKLGYDLFDFDLYSSYLIFEESSAEQVVREFLIPTFAPGLQGRIKTISAGGADGIPARFDDFLRLFVFIHTSPIYFQKAWVLADGDGAGRKNIAKLKEKFKDWPEGHFINLSKENFEEYYPPTFKKEYDSIDRIKGKEERFLQKGQLTKKLMDWIKNRPVRAKSHFKKSTKEIIDLLKQIEVALK